MCIIYNLTCNMVQEEDLISKRDVKCIGSVGDKSVENEISKDLFLYLKASS